ncbi:hypothetical protein PENSPDRAFT_610701 [Peniophora sp. CONT]|nr:hypothetical protein PENSPDRAFT_610701 [Peniophora sp. CONT]
MILPNHTLDLRLASLIALANLATVLERTALIGTSWYLDALFLVPGLHRQQDASNVNGGELPAVGAMTTGYVFRIENQAMVFWLQRVGCPGHLVDAWVEPKDSVVPGRTASQRLLQDITELGQLSFVLYAAGITLTIICFGVLSSIGDYWAVAVLAMLVVARAVNVVVLRRRAVEGWKGAKEPGVQGDLLVLLSQDRWVRLRGAVDDLKSVTSGQWIRDLEQMESFAVAGATLLVYGAVALAPNASTVGNLYIAVLLLLSVALLGMCNTVTPDLYMFDHRVRQRGFPKAYVRRVHMANEMIEEHGGRRDWAIKMGLVLTEPEEHVSDVIM